MPRRIAIFALAWFCLLGAATALAQPKSPAGPAFRWQKHADSYPKVPLRTAMTRHARFVLREVPAAGTHTSFAELRMELHKGGTTRVSWRRTLKTARTTDIVGAALMYSKGRVYLARYNRHATGCMLHAFTNGGKLLWTVRLTGIGFVAHTWWSNRVQLSMHNGSPAVFGIEGGSLGYVEVRDATTGALVSNSRLTVSP